MQLFTSTLPSVSVLDPLLAALAEAPPGAPPPVPAGTDFDRLVADLAAPRKEKERAPGLADERPAVEFLTAAMAEAALPAPVPPFTARPPDEPADGLAGEPAVTRGNRLGEPSSHTGHLQGAAVPMPDSHGVSPIVAEPAPVQATGIAVAPDVGPRNPANAACPAASRRVSAEVEDVRVSSARIWHEAESEIPGTANPAPRPANPKCAAADSHGGGGTRHVARAPDVSPMTEQGSGFDGAVTRETGFGTLGFASTVTALCEPSVERRDMGSPAGAGVSDPRHAVERFADDTAPMPAEVRRPGEPRPNSNFAPGPAAPARSEVSGRGESVVPRVALAQEPVAPRAATSADAVTLHPGSTAAPHVTPTSRPGGAAGPDPRVTTTALQRLEGRRPANLASENILDAGAGRAAGSSSRKNLLSMRGEGVTIGETSFGIAAAETVAAMPAGQLRPPPLTKDIFPDAVCGVVPPEVVPCAMDAAPAEPAAATRTETAHRAVEATRQAIDLFPPPGHPGLKLQFSVGGEPLLVRVEWQGSEVRTVFHTDSPELQALLAQEWQGVAAPEPERGIRLAPPQFLTLGDSHAGGRSQERADDRRRRPGPDGFDAESVKAIRHAPLVAASPRAPAHRTSLHLHTQA